MRKTGPLLFIFFLLIFITGCTEQIVNTIVSAFPDKLAPYETNFDQAAFQQRRDALMNSIPDNAMAVIVTNETYLRNGDVNYDFRPASTFYYLTGFEERNAVAVIRRNAVNPNTTEFIMFVEERSAGMARWMGDVYGPDGVVEHFGADSAYVYDQFGPKISAYINSGNYQSVYANFETNQVVSDVYDSSVGDAVNVLDVNVIIDEFRMVKSSDEIDMIQNAVDVTVQAFQEAMKGIEPDMYEYEVEALLDYVLRLNGCSRDAFPPIIASGSNINILHYDANQSQMHDGDLVMVDFGAEYGYYAGDITRTLPVNGKFSTKQADVYDIVLEAHQAAINAAAPGVSYYYLLNLTREMMIDRLIEKEIVTGNRNDLLATNAFRQFIPAGLAHCIGLDVHDPWPKDENEDKILQENMVLAFEPHIYFYEGTPIVDPDYWDISARIEDNVLITSTGSQILSSNLPMTRVEIEALMAQQ
jgi:Xaa-Pro aminopeptidase